MFPQQAYQKILRAVVIEIASSVDFLTQTAYDGFMISEQSFYRIVPHYQ